MMDLKSFVEETLCQIAEGIHGAQTLVAGLWGAHYRTTMLKKMALNGSRTPKRFIPKPNCRP